MTVSFYDGDKCIETKSILAGAAYGFPAISKNGYTFDGWKLGDTLIPPSQTTYTHEYSENGYEYVATWSPLSMTAVFKNGDSIVQEMTIYTDKEFSLPETPVAETGFQFDGWKIVGNNYVSAPEDETLALSYSASGYEFKATWAKVKMTVSFYNGDTLIESMQVYSAENYSFPTPPERGGYIFAGWKIGDITIPLEEKTFRLDYNASGYKYVATWYQLLTVDSNGLVSCTDTTVTDVAIPPMIDGVKVTGIANAAFENCTLLESVIICDKVTTIGYNAFNGCTSLSAIEIPDGVISISFGVFSGCTSLTEIAIPDSVTSLGNSAFSECSSLESVTIGNGVTSIGTYLFQNCKLLKSVTIGNNLTSIPYRAFAFCESLESLIIPDSVKTIDCSAFGGCENLATVDFPEDFEWTGDTANFTYCPFITSIVIPDGVTSVDFSGCENLEEITLPNTITSIDVMSFESCSSLKEIKIPNSVTTIGSRAFEDCYSLELVVIGNQVESIGAYAFDNCYKLKSVYIPESITSIGDFAFGNCMALESIYIDKEKDSISLSNAYYLSKATIYWKGEFEL